MFETKEDPDLDPYDGEYFSYISPLVSHDDFVTLYGTKSCKVKNFLQDLKNLFNKYQMYIEYGEKSCNEFLIIPLFDDNDLSYLDNFVDKTFHIQEGPHYPLFSKYKTSWEYDLDSCSRCQKRKAKYEVYFSDKKCYKYCKICNKFLFLK